MKGDKMSNEILAKPMKVVLDAAKQFLEQKIDKSSEKRKAAKEITLLLRENRLSTIIMRAKRISQQEKNPVVIELLINGHRFFFVENEGNSINFFFTKDKKTINHILV